MFNAIECRWSAVAAPYQASDGAGHFVKMVTTHRIRHPADRRVARPRPRVGFDAHELSLCFAIEQRAHRYLIEITSRWLSTTTARADTGPP
jgi:hypothetical protein